jgi:4-hydroxy-3-polyprenylbenzoate decarboxylase
MAYRSFRNFLDTLEQAGELKRIAIPVDTELLIAEWADREMKSPGGGKALLFEQPIVDGKKSEFPLAINMVGSSPRMAMGL